MWPPVWFRPFRSPDVGQANSIPRPNEGELVAPNDGALVRAVRQQVVPRVIGWLEAARDGWDRRNKPLVHAPRRQRASMPAEPAAVVRPRALGLQMFGDGFEAAKRIPFRLDGEPMPRPASLAQTQLASAGPTLPPGFLASTADLLG